jgi:ABC-2 type transport system ATP-binding protein
VVETGTPIGSSGALSGVHDLTVDGCHAEFSVDTGQLDRVLAELVRHHIRTLTSSPPTLEELFIRHYDDGTDRPARTQAGVR